MKKLLIFTIVFTLALATLAIADKTKRLEMNSTFVLAVKVVHVTRCQETPASVHVAKTW